MKMTMVIMMANRQAMNKKEAGIEFRLYRLCTV